MPPARFEAGTPAIAEAIGLGAACDYLSALDMENVHQFELDIGRWAVAVAGYGVAVAG